MTAHAAAAPAPLRDAVERATLGQALGHLATWVEYAYTGAPLRIGFSSSWCWEWPNTLFTNRRVSPPLEALHVIEQNLALLAPLGITGLTPEFRIPARPAADRRIEEFLDEQGIKSRDLLVALNPGAGRENKRWPVPLMRALAERLGAELTVLTVHREHGSGEPTGPTEPEEQAA